MIFDELVAIIERKFTLNPTNEQRNAIVKFCDFLLSRDGDSVFLLTGYAGTGKTTLVGSIVKTMVELKQRVVLLAPTGRAAKVFALHADQPAFTIHRKIYREKSTGGEFTLNPPELNRDTLFVVDEASMIANEGLSGATFGTGRLLDDLIQFVYGGTNCRLMLIGDSAQLPPVGEELSPALSTDALRGYGLLPTHCDLTEVVRQQDGSGILWNATMLRNCLLEELIFEFPRFRIHSFPDIEVVMGNELIERLENSYYHTGKDGTIVVTRSNKRANIFNMGIRARILGFEEELSSGDQLIVVKNNYKYGINTNINSVETWQQDNAVKQKNSNDNKGGSFIANGDTVVVRRYRNERSLYGFRFVDATLRFPDYDHAELECTLLLDTLQAEAPALTREQQDQLFNAVWEDYPDITNKRDRMKKLREDIYFNALQVKYAYAVTCHKAQGGQWEHVYIDQGYITEEMLSPDYFRWLYTAITRATDKVYLINWPKEQISNEE